MLNTELISHYVKEYRLMIKEIHLNPPPPTHIRSEEENAKENPPRVFHMAANVLDFFARLAALGGETLKSSPPPPPPQRANAQLNRIVFLEMNWRKNQLNVLFISSGRFFPAQSSLFGDATKEGRAASRRREKVSGEYGSELLLACNSINDATKLNQQGKRDSAEWNASGELLICIISDNVTIRRFTKATEGRKSFRRAFGTI
jgi:hypothetical protein